LSDFFSGKRVVVTGGAGFLGRHVVRKLDERGCASVVVPPRATCDLRQWSQICELLEQARPHLVIHLAVVVDNPVGEGNSAACFYDNVMMNTQLMEAARQRGVEKMVYMGSASSYPQAAPVPYREEDFWNGYPDPTRSAYGIAKKMALVQSQAYHRGYGFHCLFLIPTNLFGPGDNVDPPTCYVIPSLIRQFFEAIQKGEEEVVLGGSGNSTRDFLFVEDCAEAVLLALERCDESEPVNLGSGCEIPIRDLAARIAELAGYAGKILWDGSRPDGPGRRRLEVSRAERAFGFRARKDFLEGLRETVEWYRKTRLPTEQRSCKAVCAVKA